MAHETHIRPADPSPTTIAHEAWVGSEPLSFVERTALAQTHYDAAFSELLVEQQFASVASHVEPSAGPKGWESGRDAYTKALADSMARSEVTDVNIADRAAVLTRVALTLSPDIANPKVVTGLEKVVARADSTDFVLNMAHVWSDRLLQVNDPDVRRERALEFKTVMHKLWLQECGHITGIDGATKENIVTSLADAFAATYAYQDRQTDDMIVRAFLAGRVRNLAVDLAMRWLDGKQTTRLTDVLEATYEEHSEDADKIVDLAYHYGKNHGLGDTTVEGLATHVFPRLKAGDPVVKPLQDPGGSFAYSRRDHEAFGLGDFITAALTQEVHPANIQELVRISYDIPASDQARYELNRRDAIMLSDQFKGLRDFIHGQHPGSHDVIDAMLAFKRTGNSARLRAWIQQSSTLQTSSARLLDPSKYDKKGHHPYNRGVQPEPIMDILERLEKNTRPVDEQPPKLADEKLSGLLEAAHDVPPAEKRDAIHDATRALNERLKGMMAARQIGMEPDMVQAIAWLERGQFKVLQGLTFEDQIGLAKQEWFKDVLEFHELTHNAAYDEAEFGEFMSSLKGLSDRSAFRRISERVIGQTRDLAESYVRRGMNHWSDALWSGNTTHELIGLVDPREAATAVGRRLMAEYQRQA